MNFLFIYFFSCSTCSYYIFLSGGVRERGNKNHAGNNIYMILKTIFFQTSSKLQWTYVAYGLTKYLHLWFVFIFFFFYSLYSKHWKIVSMWFDMHFWNDGNFFKEWVEILWIIGKQIMCKNAQTTLKQYIFVSKTKLKIFIIKTLKKSLTNYSSEFISYLFTK